MDTGGKDTTYRPRAIVPVKYSLECGGVRVLGCLVEMIGKRNEVSKSLLNSVTEKVEPHVKPFYLGAYVSNVSGTAFRRPDKLRETLFSLRLSFTPEQRAHLVEDLNHLCK